MKIFHFKEHTKEVVSAVPVSRNYIIFVVIIKLFKRSVIYKPAHFSIKKIQKASN